MEILVTIGVVIVAIFTLLPLVLMTVAAVWFVYVCSAARPPAIHEGRLSVASKLLAIGLLSITVLWVVNMVVPFALIRLVDSSAYAEVLMTLNIATQVIHWVSYILIALGLYLFARQHRLVLESVAHTGDKPAESTELDHSSQSESNPYKEL